MARPVILVALGPQDTERFLGEEGLARLGGLGEVVVWDLAVGWADCPARERVGVVVTGWRTPPLTPAVLDSLPCLRLVAHVGGTVRALVDAAAYARGVLVTTQAAANAEPVAAYATAVVVMALKGAFSMREDYRAGRGRFARDAALAAAGIAGRTVGIVGCSTIGRLVVERLQALPVRVRAYDPTLASDDPVLDLATRDDDLAALCAASDVLSVHAPLLDATRGMVGAAELAALPDGATVVNTARGAVVDEGALVAELASGRLRAVLDVTVDEPPHPDSPLWDLPNVFLTPHLAGSIGGEMRLLGAGAVDEVERFVTGRPLRHAATGAAHVA